MRDGLFSLDGFEFGAGTEVKVRAFDSGSRMIKDDDWPVPGGHGVLMGRDTVQGAEWTFDLVVKGGGGADTFDLAESLRGMWERQHEPGALSVLRYALPGRVRRVYGRPRRFAPTGGAVKEGWHWNHYPVLATFRLADALSYDDEARVLSLGLVAAPQGGVVLPETLPWVLAGREGRRDGQVTVEGRAEVPFTLTFHGPASGSASGWWAEGPGWRVDLAASLAWDQTATVDTRTGTVTRSDGVSLAGAARGRFLTARLRPGTSEVSWGANDPTNTARLSLTHRPGYHSL